MFKLTENYVTVKEIEIELDGSDILEEVYTDLKDKDKEELIRWLTEDCLIPEMPKWLIDQDFENMRVKMFMEYLETIAQNMRLLSAEEEELITNIAKRF